MLNQPYISDMKPIWSCCMCDLNVFLNLFCKCLLEDFCINIYQRN